MATAVKLKHRTNIKELMANSKPIFFLGGEWAERWCCGLSLHVGALSKAKVAIWLIKEPDGQNVAAMLIYSYIDRTL